MSHACVKWISLSVDKLSKIIISLPPLSLWNSMMDDSFLFQEKRRMKEHILTVHQSMRFACKICGKTYASSLSLRNHVRLNHEGKKPPPEKCPHCEKIFKGIGTLKRHIDNVHEKKRPHACHLCGLSFSQSGNLKNHLKGKHKHVIW